MEKCSTVTLQKSNLPEKYAFNLVTYNVRLPRDLYAMYISSSISAQKRLAVSKSQI